MKGLFHRASLEFMDVAGSLTVQDFRTFAGRSSFKQCLSAVVLMDRCRRFWSQIKIQTTIKTQKTVSGRLALKVATSRPFAVFVS